MDAELDTEWMAQGNCADKPPSLFFPSDGVGVEVAKRVAQADIVISTALIPGREAPTLVTEAMVHSMKPGSVIVDLAAGRGAPAGPGDGVAGAGAFTGSS